MAKKTFKLHFSPTIHANKSVLLFVNLSSLYRIKTTIFFHESQNYRSPNCWLAYISAITYMQILICSHIQIVLMFVGLQLSFRKQESQQRNWKNLFFLTASSMGLSWHSPHNPSNLVILLNIMITPIFLFLRYE